MAEIPGWSAGLVTKEFGPSSGGNCTESINNGYCTPLCLLPITFWALTRLHLPLPFFFVVLCLLLSSCRCRHCRHCCRCDVVVLRWNFLFWKWPVGPHPFDYPADKLPMHLSVRSTTTFRTFSELPRHSTTFKSIMQTLCYIFVMLVEAGPGDLLWPENSLGILKGWWSIIPLRRLRLFLGGGLGVGGVYVEIHKDCEIFMVLLVGKKLRSWNWMENMGGPVVKYPGIF